MRCFRSLIALPPVVIYFVFRLKFYPRLTRTHTVLTGRKNAHTSSKALPIHKVFPAAFSSSGRFSASAKLLAPDSDGFSSDFWLLRRRCVVTPRNQIKAQQSGFDLKRKKERAKCSFRRKAETKWRKFLLTMRKVQKAPERHAVRRMCSCQSRVQGVMLIFRRTK